MADKFITLGNLAEYSSNTDKKIREFVNDKVSEVIHPEYTLIKKDTADEGYISSYNLTKNGEVVGSTINIPKDYLVKSATLETVTVKDTPVEGYIVGDKYIDFVVNTVQGDENTHHIYLLVSDLVDTYKSGQGIVISDDNVVSIVIQDGTKTVGGITSDDYTDFKGAVTKSNDNETAIDSINAEIEQNKTDILNNQNDIKDLQTVTSLNAKVIFSFNFQRTGKVYTVRFPLWETSQTCNGEKLDDNEGLVCNPSTAVTRGISDYDDIPLFKTYDCNAYVDDNGVRHITAIKGDKDFKDTGKVDVFVLGMSYYEKWWESDGYAYYSRTDMPKEGYTLASECRTKDGTDQGFALYGKYIAGDIDGMPYSSKGLVPARYCSGRPSGSQNISYSGNIPYFHKRGSHYSGTFMSEVKYIATTWWLKYGTRNSQSVMAGCTNYSVQYVSTVAETDVKRIIISNANANYFDVGMSVSIGDNGGSAPDRNKWDCHNKAESATITAIESYDENNKAIYVDVDTAFNTTTTTYISTFHWRSGFSDKVIGRDGCPCVTSNGLTNGKYPVVFQGIECFVGIYETISNAIVDIINSSGTRNVYITKDSSILTSTASDIKAKYQRLDNQISLTKLNAWNYITAVSVDTENGAIIPTASGQPGSSSSTGYADAVYVDSGTSGQRELLAFGRLGIPSVSGVSFVVCGSDLSLSSWTVGCRLSING